MTQEQAQRLLDYTQTAGVEARVHQIGNGEWVVILRKHDYYLWSFADWDVYCHELKKQRKQQRKAERSAVNGIDARESYTLRLPALV